MITQTGMKQAFRYLNEMTDDEREGLAMLIAAPNKLIKTITLINKKLTINVDELTDEEAKERYT